MRNVWLLGMTSLLTDVSSEMILPILPFFIEALGGKGLAIGLAAGLGEAAASFFKLFSGWLAERTRKKGLVFTGYGLSSVAKLFMGMASTWSAVVAFRTIDRIGKGIRTSPRDALIAESVTARGRGFGLHRALDTAGAIIGSIIVLTYLYCTVPQLANYKIVIFVAAIIGFTALIPLIWVREKRITHEPISFRRLPWSPEFKAFLTITTLFAFGNVNYMFFLLKLAKGLELTVTAQRAILITLAFYILFNVIYTAFAYPIGKWSDRIGKHPVVITAFGLYFLIAMGFATLDGYWLLVPFMFYGLFFALLEGTQRAWGADIMKRHYGMQFGIFHFLTGIATLIGGLVAGVLWDINPDYTFYFGASISLLTLVVVAFIRHSLTKSST